MNMPRVRGKVGQITVEDHGTPEEKALRGQWSWMIEVYVVDSKMRDTVWHTIEGAYLQERRVFPTEQAAKENLEKEVKYVVTLLQKAAGDPDPDGAYFNLKTGEYYRPKKDA